MTKKKIFFLNIIEKCNLSTVESNYTSIQNKRITQINKKKKAEKIRNKYQKIRFIQVRQVQ